MLLPIFRPWVIVSQTWMTAIRLEVVRSGHILKVELVLSFDRYDIEYERKMGVKDDFKNFVL